jgi:hypothetical protein
MCFIFFIIFVIVIIIIFIITFIQIIIIIIMSVDRVPIEHKVGRDLLGPITRCLFFEQTTPIAPTALFPSRLIPHTYVTYSPTECVPVNLFASKCLAYDIIALEGREME